MTAATLTDAWSDLQRDAQRGVATSTQIKYVAIGTDGTTPDASDTQLGAEAFRKAITATADGGSAGEGTFTLSLAPQDAVGVVIAEVGWFAGSDATSAANSGVLVGRGLYSHTKTDAESITIVFTLDN